MNRMACLWLTQRCVDIFICVRQEVQDAGGDVGDELKGPVDKLVACIFLFGFFAAYMFPSSVTDTCLLHGWYSSFRSRSNARS
jgi:hypothetical protein